MSDITLDVGPVEGTDVTFDAGPTEGTDITFDVGATTGGGGGVTLPIDTSDVTGLDTALAGKQPVDSDLTAIAALTTTSFGRGLLALADAAALRTSAGLGTAALSASGDFQPVDSDLTAIAALTTTSYGRAFLALADAAAGRTALGLGTLATASTIASADITDGTIVDADINASAAIAQSKIASLASDLAAKAATSALTYPKRHSIPCSVSPPNSYTTWTPTLSAVTYNGYAAGAGSETWTYELVMMAGTWSIRWVYRKTSSGGIITATLAGVSLTTVDTYNASNAEANVTQTGITVSASGYQSLVLTNPTKNGSSGGYGFIIHGIELWRTGP